MAVVLAVDTTAKPVSCALVKDQRVLASFFANTGLTHSQTLMPMIEQVLQMAELTMQQVDALAVNAGPGSFTGVRIGVSAVKGLAFTSNIPCVSVSTLESMAEMVPISGDTVVCGVMDARCQQVYTALFTKNEAGEPVRISKDEAISIAELGERLKDVEKTVILVGDGSELCYRALRESIPNVLLAPASSRYQNAAATALIAERYLAVGDTVDAKDLLPVYLRLPQAERELNSRNLKNETVNP